MEFQFSRRAERIQEGIFSILDHKKAELLAKGTGLKVNVSENPVSGVALGLAKIIKDDNYKSVAYLEGMSR